MNIPANMTANQLVQLALVSAGGTFSDTNPFSGVTRAPASWADITYTINSVFINGTSGTNFAPTAANNNGLLVANYAPADGYVNLGLWNTWYDEGCILTNIRRIEMTDWDDVTQTSTPNGTFSFGHPTAGTAIRSVVINFRVDGFGSGGPIATTAATPATTTTRVTTAATPATTTTRVTTAATTTTRPATTTAATTAATVGGGASGSHAVQLVGVVGPLPDDPWWDDAIIRSSNVVINANGTFTATLNIPANMTANQLVQLGIVSAGGTFSDTNPFSGVTRAPASWADVTYTINSVFINGTSGSNFAPTAANNNGLLVANYAPIEGYVNLGLWNTWYDEGCILNNVRRIEMTDWDEATGTSTPNGTFSFGHPTAGTAIRSIVVNFRVDGFGSSGAVAAVTTTTTRAATAATTAATAATPPPAAGARVITLDVNGGTALSPNTRNTDSTGNLAMALPTPTRGGNWHFMGWWTAQTGGTRVLAGPTGTRFTANTTVYARWQETAPIQLSAMPANMRTNFDWLRNTRHVREPVLFGRHNLAFDQIWRGDGTSNWAIRWESTRAVTLAERRNIANMLQVEMNKWTHPLIGMPGWPFGEIPTTVVGWAVSNGALIQDRQPNEIVWVNNDHRAPMGEMNARMASAPANISRFQNFNAVNNGTFTYAGGLHARFDMYLWCTTGFGGGAGGDWGSRQAETYVITAANGGNTMIITHEIGHSFGLYDFYGAVGTDRPPAAGGVNFGAGDLRTLMHVGSGAPSGYPLGAYDQWQIRYYWDWIRSGSPATRFVRPTSGTAR